MDGGFRYSCAMSSTEYTSDTSAEAEEIQLALLRQMTPQQRLEMMWRLSCDVRGMAFNAIRRRHPDYSEAEIRLAFIELTYGKQLADDVRRSQESHS